MAPKRPRTMQVLPNSASVAKGIRDLFRPSGHRRVAISAFVGDGSEAYLPKPEGLHLVCWPKAGGTNPKQLRYLMKRGVRVQFADRLHMKVYWSEDKGSIITSANLSTNALGSGELKEMGVKLGPGIVDIDAILAAIKPFDVTEKNLLRLDQEHKAYHAKNRFKGEARADSFDEWLDLPIRPAWKIMIWDHYLKHYSEQAEAITKEEYGHAPYDVLTRDEFDFTPDDWVLTVKVRGAAVRCRS